MVMKPTSNPAFWVTNRSPRNVTLADLAINIKAFTTVNLLDKRHHNYTLEQLNKSRESGSIFNKRDKIKVRRTTPETTKRTVVPFLQDAIIPSRERSLLAIQEKEYEELKVFDESDSKEMQKVMDEEFARESVELEEEVNKNGR
jgi:Mg/Co/Ni transporter MgtE